jgi:hypothetical protein
MPADALTQLLHLSNQILTAHLIEIIIHSYPLSVWD